MLLNEKKIILGITGSIAAYKAATLTRNFIKEGAAVKIILTPYASQFITPVTLATLSKNTVLYDFFKHDDGTWNNHVELGLWADVMLIAPATANTIAKMANGIADNLLLTTYLSARCPVVVAPAMDCDMYNHPATIQNINKLKTFGVTFIEPATGELASGLDGKGRMQEPEKIISFLIDLFSKKKKASPTKKVNGKHFIITAGPTIEAIDPVRYLSNHSTGKMGYAIAEELAYQGAKVTLISGPTNLITTHKNINRINVTTAKEMYDECKKIFPKTNGAIMAAAVADYKPINTFTNKIKKINKTLTITLEPTQDILSELGKIKKKTQLLIGFALETNNEIENAKQKLHSKNLDFIVLNSLNDKNAGFGYNTNKITIIYANNKIEKFELKQKHEIAIDIVDRINKIIL